MLKLQHRNRYLQKITSIVQIIYNSALGSARTYLPPPKLAESYVFLCTRAVPWLDRMLATQGVITADLAIFMCVLATCVILVSTAIFYAEQNGPHADFFPDIPSSMWWTVITFTSVGYGDIYPGVE